MSTPPTIANAPPAPKAKKEQPSKPKEYNPRWLGYVYILFSSLVNFASIAHVTLITVDRHKISIAIGIVTFAFANFVLLLDRFQLFLEKFNYKEAWDGKLEGLVLLGSVIWWIIGVTLQTSAGGIAYYATNIYISAWLALASCIYTLDKWSGSKDILTLQELTGVSKTLRCWYCLFVSSMIVFGSASNMHHLVPENQRDEAGFAIALGVSSCVLSGFFIMVHYRFFSRPALGGWIELICAFIMILLWAVGVAILTSPSSIASSVTGVCGLPQSLTIQPDDDVLDPSFSPQGIPGSNLYVFSWLALLSSIDITLRWKSTRALAFAQAGDVKQQGAEGAASTLVSPGETTGHGTDTDDTGAAGDHDDEDI